MLLSISAKVFEVFVQPDTANHLVLEKGGKATLHRCFRALLGSIVTTFEWNFIRAM